MPHFVEEVRRICEQVWSERVILAISGGVCSAAALLGKAIDLQLSGGPSTTVCCGRTRAKMW